MIYNPEYNNSWAIVIGINDYNHLNPLGYAKNDAEAIVQILINSFNFPKKNIIRLYDNKATRKNIFDSYMRFTQGDIEQDDRLLVFFAGHGYTKRGNRSDIGFLVPVDGDTNDLSTLIRWDDLTKNAELIQAKHIFFIMDACFSGLAITRSPAGSTRYLKDMLQRYSRQVLTAGKTDEVVADLGGPVPEHSIFTGHLLEALDGKATDDDGTLTANMLMSYVFNKVSKDIYSKQTPHYGYFEGEGDFIFNAPILESLNDNEKIDKDVLIEIPSTNEVYNNDLIIEQVKEYISDDRYRIKLDSLVNQQLRKFLSETDSDKLPTNVSTDYNSIQEYMKKYEQLVTNLQHIIIPLAHWGDVSYRPILGKLISRVTDNIKIKSGSSALLYLRWYPALILLYSGGISTIASNNYASLKTMFMAPIESSKTYGETNEFIISIVEAMLELDRMNVFQKIPGHERFFAPRSEYLFKLLQPLLDDILFLGKSYENAFDTFEVFYALMYASFMSKRKDRVWGPPGRFAWKYRNHDRNAFADILFQAATQKEDWVPLKAGLFEGSYDEFHIIADQYRELILQLQWH